MKPLFRKRRKFWKNSQGVSGIVATIFLVLIVLLVSANVFTFVLNENVRYQNVVSEVNQMDATMHSERISLFNENYTVVDDKIFVQTAVRNDGPVSVQLVTLWTVDATTGKYGYNDTLNIDLNIGAEAFFTESNPITVTIPGSSSTDEFFSWFVTRRGNRISLKEEGEDDILVSHVTQGIGSLALEFDYFRYFTYESTTKLANYPNGTLGFDLPANTYVAFGCYLSNFDPRKQAITIDSHALFWQPGRAGVAEGAWFIVNVNSDGSINATYTPITLQYRETKMLVFASKSDLGIGAFDRVRTPNTVTTVATNLLLHGTIGAKAFAQNIPFVSLFYS